MKKNVLLVGSALMLLSTSAFATKARLQALGEDKDGSYFISDYRNVYINPSELNSLKDMAVLEWGGAGSNISGALGGASLDLDNATKAQGGVFYGLSNGMKIGAVLGDETDVAALTRILASNGGAAGTGLQSADNVVDVFVAGKASVNWGANLLYSSTDSEVTGVRYKQHAYATRLGVSEGVWNAHALIALGAKAEAPDNALAQSYKGKFGVRLGGGYDLSAEKKVFGMYENYSWDQANNATASRVGTFSKGILGFGHTKKVTENSSMFVKLQGEKTHIQLDGITGLVAAKIDRLAFPLTVGFEHTATDWLVLRGSLVQNIYGTVNDEGLTANFGTPATADDYTTMGKSIRLLAASKYGASTSGNGGKKTLANSTAVNAGATLNFGKLSLDGLIGATKASTAARTVNGSEGVLAVDNLMSRVALTYNF